MQTMYPGKVNSPQTELAQAIDDTQTTIPLLDASVLPAAPNLATIGTGEDAETILYTGVSGNDLTGVTRGFQGQAKSWSAGVKVARLYTAYDHDAFIENINSHASRHAAGGADPITPADIGAVSKSGDTMTGNLNFSGSYINMFPPETTGAWGLGIAFRSQTSGGISTTIGGTGLYGVGDETRYAYLVLGGGTGHPSIYGTGLRIRDTGPLYYDGTAERAMWHAGNLPVESGTWTPTVRGASVAGSPSYSVRKGSYTKVGNFVFATAYLTFAKDASMSGIVLISGLPFIISGDDGSGMISAISGIDVESTGYRSVTLSVFGGVDYVTIRKQKLDNASIESTVTSDDLLSEVSLRIGMTYRTT